MNRPPCSSPRPSSTSTHIRGREEDGLRLVGEEGSSGHLLVDITGDTGRCSLGRLLTTYISRVGEPPTMLVHKTLTNVDPYPGSGGGRFASCGGWGLVLDTSWLIPSGTRNDGCVEEFTGALDFMFLVNCLRCSSPTPPSTSIHIVGRGKDGLCPIGEEGSSCTYPGRYHRYHDVRQARSHGTPLDAHM